MLEQRDIEFQRRTVHLEIFRPTGSGPYPVVIMLHGSGGLYTQEASIDQRDNFGEHQIASSGCVAVLVRYLDYSGVRFATPDVIQRDSRSWIRVVDAAIEFIRSLPYADNRGIAVYGESLGGYLGLAVGLKRPDVKEVFILSGGFAEEFSPRIVNRPKVEMYHGDNDVTIPLESAKHSCTKLRSASVECRLHVLHRTGHIPSQECIQTIVADILTTMKQK